MEESGLALALLHDVYPGPAYSEPVGACSSCSAGKPGKKRRFSNRNTIRIRSWDMRVSDKKKFEVDLSHLPDCPGAYLMKDREDRIVYVGKANNLRSRVRSHFSHPASRFAPLVNRVEYIAAENSGEALLLEYNLIKKHHPPFNIRLRDDKRYPYIKLTMAEPWPRAFLTRTLKEDGSYYFGPYPNVRAARLVLGAVKEIFPYRGCKYQSRDFPLPAPVSTMR
jgi:excinuclease UvrABC nuclease subunit